MPPIPRKFFDAPKAPPSSQEAPGNGDGRREQLAINLMDLDRIDEFMRGVLLWGKLDLSQPVRMDRDRIDEVGIVFTCPLVEAAATIDVIRGHDRRAGDYPTRAYVRKRAWSKIPGGTPVTIVVDEKVVLNPEVFREEAKEVVIVIPSPERVF